MKFAPVCPIHIYEHLEECGPEYLGDYFLLLAHDVLANKERYSKFFKGKNYTVIMDNSVIELGNAVSASVLLEAAEAVDATCIAIPDVLEDGQATCQRAAAFLNEWRGLQKAKNFGLMFIPQGKNLSDFMQCADYALRSFGGDIQWIGIPRNTTGRILPSRKQIMSIVWTFAMRESIIRKQPIQQFHMLGFSHDMVDDVAVCAEWGTYVKGIDSAVPLRLGSQGTEIKNRAIGFVDPGPRGDWWETVAIQPGSMIAQNTLVTRKILGELPWEK